MKPAPTPVRDKLLAIIQRRGHITSIDLYEESGVRVDNQRVVLEPAIASGLVKVETSNRSGRGRPGSAWRWVGARAGHDPNRPGPRTCLGCGEKFRSDSAANRICPTCKTANQRASCGRFDEPAVIRYR